MKNKLLLVFALTSILGCDNSFRKENEELTIKIEELNHKISKLEEENTNCKNGLDKIQSDLDQLESEYNDFREECDRLIEVNYNNGYADGWNDLRSQLR